MGVITVLQLEWQGYRGGGVLSFPVKVSEHYTFENHVLRYFASNQARVNIVGEGEIYSL